ncbi:hypothetical protein [Winogradskyella jejuensis]|uniref:Uncharacterized protein n=1 Tax=Winogradskyella jejuensis TaxID=1089305 RepID=A0A1M5U4B4_9FLAO|nr:hypothetical protein [Winogradskyella jejuensis]SHH57935.1 hypothetical protein SAMN05444148_2364 [Winogradskyella jejuensis]
MKKVTLLLAVMLIGLTTATAAEKVSANIERDLDITSRYNYVQPILFVERGVEFLIFADGSFDFNTDVFGNSTRPNYYRNRRGNVNRSFGAPGTTYRHRGARGVSITHDYLGRVRRIGNVFINYDRQGRIKRVGTVYMRYRFNRLQQVGNLRLQYNRRGRLIGFRGFVNHNNRDCNIFQINDWNNWDNDYDDDDDFYYYRQNGKVKKHKKLNRRFRDDD